MDGRTPASVIASLHDSDPNILPLWPEALRAPAAPQTPTIHERLWPTRLIAALAALVVGGLWAAQALVQIPPWHAAAAATISCGLLVFAALVCGYWTDPALRRTRTLSRGLRHLSGAIHRWTAEEQQLLTACEQLQHVIGDEEGRLELRREQLQTEGRTRHLEARRVCQQAIVDAEARREALLQTHERTQRELQLEYEAVSAAFRGRLADLSQQGELETAARLAEHQHHDVTERLAQLRIADSDLADDVKGRLQGAGIWTLAQLTSERAVEAGFHTLQIEALLSWRQGVQRMLRQDTPSELPSDETRELVVRYHAARRDLEQERQASHARLSAAMAEAEAQCQASLAGLTATIEQLQAEWKAYRRAIGATYEARFESERSPCQGELARRREELAQASNALLGVQVELVASRADRQRLNAELAQLPAPFWASYLARVLGWQATAAASETTDESATDSLEPRAPAAAYQPAGLRRAA